MLNALLNNYFGFNRQQRNGLVVLMAASCLLLVIRITYPKFIKPDAIEIKNLPLYEQKIDSALNRSGTNEFEHSSPLSSKSIFVFNPNTVNYDQLLLLGFKDKAAKRFLKFRNKGFVFKTKKDLKKLYGMTDRFYEQLEPYIIIDGPKTKAVNHPKEKNEKQSVANPSSQVQKLELNSADSISLVQLNGIGPSFAKRILKYRSILGGYVSVEQLREVYGFTAEICDKIIPLFEVNPALIKKIDLNKDSFKAVNKHPYLTYEMTKLIFDWRRKSLITATNLKEILNDDALYNKVLPYLQFE